MRTHKAEPRLDGSLIVAMLDDALEHIQSGTRKMARASMSLATMGEGEIERSRRLAK